MELKPILLAACLACASGSALADTAPSPVKDDLQALKADRVQVKKDIHTLQGDRSRERADYRKLRKDRIEARREAAKAKKAAPGAAASK
ncbi:MAG TPA: hypothetical protein VNE59_10395 [Burkholderiales bacterium]|nr:hypothetical protein [Burkholderiales bacterium]